MRSDVFKKISTYSHAELDKFGTASLVNRITNDINQIETAIGIFMRTILRVPFLLIGAFVLSLVINIKMSLIFLVLIPLLTIGLIMVLSASSPSALSESGDSYKYFSKQLLYNESVE